MEKSEIEKLSLVELKNICKKEGLNFNKSREELIFALNEYFEPMRVKPEPQRKLPKLKIKGVKLSDSEQLHEMSKLVEKKLAHRIYYANDSIYFELK